MTIRTISSWLLAVALATTAWAVRPVNQDETGVAIEGYDPVAYHAERRPVRGSAEFTHVWQGATWRFASRDHRDRFAAEPERFAPRYGGYCAWAVSQGETAPIDPEAWSIVDGKLYLNYSPRIRRRWEKRRSELIEQADRNWPGLLDDR